MALHRQSLRTAAIGAALGVVLTIAFQFGLLGQAVPSGVLTGNVASLGSSGATWERCRTQTGEADTICQCAAKKLTAGPRNPVFEHLAFGGTLPGDLKPENVSDPAKTFAADVRKLESDLLQVCREIDAEDRQTLGIWLKSCEAEDNSEQACRCFYDNMRERLSGEAWPRFRRTLHQDVTIFLDPFQEGRLGDNAVEQQLEIGKNIPPAMLQCGLKPSKEFSASAR